MIRFTDSLRQEVDQSLSVINAKEVDTLKKTEEITSLLRNAFNRLRFFIYEYKFGNEEEEILFFKEIKPELFCDLIYYRKMYNLEIYRPQGGQSEQKMYWEKELKRIADFFDKNRSFYCYYRSSETSLDSQYFLRGKIDHTLYQDSISHELDPKFSTIADLTLTRILANDKLEEYIKEKLNLLNGENKVSHPKEKLTWTAKKVFLVELIYLLYWVGVFNNGKANLKEISAYFEQMFNIDLGSNLSSCFAEMRLRKNQTPFLDLLRRAFSEKMEETYAK